MAAYPLGGTDVENRHYLMLTSWEWRGEDQDPTRHSPGKGYGTDRMDPGLKVNTSASGSKPSLTGDFPKQLAEGRSSDPEGPSQTH